MKTIIVDTSYLIYRSYFAYPDLRVDGQPIGAFFGFAKTVLALVKEHNPDRLIFATDTPKPTWRHDILPEYKGTRPKMEDNMRCQIPIILDWCKLITKNFFACEGFEADDIINTISHDLSKDLDEIDSDFLKNKLVKENDLFSDFNDDFDEDGHEDILIFSSDKDLYQILNHSNIFFIRPKKPFGFELYGKNEFRKQHGLEPEQWVDYKALVGDASDNLKGVDGIGPKTAVKILTETHSLKNLFAKIGLDGLDFDFGTTEDGDCEKFLQEKKNVRYIDKIKDSYETVKRTYKLAKLQFIKDLSICEEKFDLSKGLELFKKYKFSSLIRQAETKSEGESEALF